MGRDSKHLKILINHFNAIGWPLDVNQDKLFSHYHLKSDDELSESRIVEIERHRPILGISYVPGLPMEAFETYFMRFAVNELTLEVTELPERRGELTININGIVSRELDDERFELKIEAIDEHKYEIREGVTGYHQEITNIDEANNFCESFVDQFVDSFSEILDLNGKELNIDDHQREELLSAFSKGTKVSILKKAEDAWLSREMYE